MSWEYDFTIAVLSRLCVLAMVSLVAILARLLKSAAWLRSRYWARREIERVKNDPSHALHRPYYATSKGYKGISPLEHQQALTAVHALFGKAYPEPFVNRLRKILGFASAPLWWPSRH